jgi:fermentation-respiration switch protein FrsA (DUF1100 family)
VVLLTGYVGAIIVLMLLENWLVYRPSGPEEWAKPPDPLIQDVELTTADGTKLHAWWFAKEGSPTALLYLHGNGGNLSWRGTTIAKFRQELDCSVMIVDYPGYGKSEGRPSEAGCYAAADAAYLWLTTTPKIRGDQIILYGASLGGGVAVNLASRQPHRALVLVKTFTSMPDVGQSIYPIVPVRWLMRNRYDSLAKIAQCKRPIFIAHGDADTLVPFSHGERLFEAANEPKEFLRLEGADHNDAVPEEFFVHLKAFLGRTTQVSGGR